MSELDVPSATYPVAFDLDRDTTGRNRLTCFFRLLLAIPHNLLVGSPGGGGSNGFLSLCVVVLAVVSWFVILFTGKQPRSIWDFTVGVLAWKSRAYTYMALLRDEYPPFGAGDYPVSFSAGEFPEQRDRLSVLLRIFLLIPHAIVLAFVGIAWAMTVVIGWLAILFTGSYPAGLYNFSAGYLRWYLRFETYSLLVRDEYPPFSLT